MEHAVRFYLANGVTEQQAKSSNYYIYAHECSDGIYVGLSTDSVKRWLEHKNEAINKDSREYNSKFRAAIRSGLPFKHYIIAVCSFEKAARTREAAAIRHYGTLNTRNELAVGEYDFQSLNRALTSVVLKGTGRTSKNGGRSDSDRKVAIGRIYMEGGRKRVLSVKNENFQAGLKIECSREERSKFNVGDLVKVKAALSQKQGRDYLVAAKTSPLIKA